MPTATNLFDADQWLTLFMTLFCSFTRSSSSVTPNLWQPLWLIWQILTVPIATTQQCSIPSTSSVVRDAHVQHIPFLPKQIWVFLRNDSLFGLRAAYQICAEQAYLSITSCSLSVCQCKWSLCLCKGMKASLLVRYALWLQWNMRKHSVDQSMSKTKHHRYLVSLVSLGSSTLKMVPVVHWENTKSGWSKIFKEIFRDFSSSSVFCEGVRANFWICPTTFSKFSPSVQLFQRLRLINEQRNL